MDDLIPAVESHTDLEACVEKGWEALRRRDLQEARAALQELFSADPAHPALPLLAAEIRRVRPKPIPWRAAVFAIAILAAAGFGVRWWSTTTRVPAGVSSESSVARHPVVQPSTPSVSQEAPTEVGTAGHVQPPELPHVTRNVSPVTVDDDVVIRQAIQRFEGAYQSRWGALTFSHCDVSRELDTATATCRPRASAAAPDEEVDTVWMFSLRKSDAGWRIASVQPPSATPQ